MTREPRPFSLRIPDAAIEELADRLGRTRWADQAPGGAPWQYGTDLVWLQRLVAYWRDDFDWRVQEAFLNHFPQFKVRLDDVDLHYLHVPGKGPDPKPLLLLHGWPGSIFEFTELIPRLADPARFGGDPADAFTVIAPSLPGYGLSFEPGQKRFGTPAIADIMATLMSEVLGYPRFVAQGGDWGAFISSSLAIRHKEKIAAIHLNMIGNNPHVTIPDDASEDERRYAAEMARWAREETGYIAIQGTRPQTLAFALTDSPAGLAAWIAEKFHQWSDHDGEVETVIPRDHLLANIALYWFTGCIGASFWPYYDRLHGDWPIPAGQTVDVPTGYAAFPREIRRPPRSIARHSYTDIRRWTRMDKGGHFAAMEQPQALAQDIQSFFKDLRATW